MALVAVVPTRVTPIARTSISFSNVRTPPAALSVFNPDFHEGVVGIVASRIKDRRHRPTFVFALGIGPMVQVTLRMFRMNEQERLAAEGEALES